MFSTYFPQAYAYAPGQRLERSTAIACWGVRVEDILQLQGGMLNISEAQILKILSYPQEHRFGFSGGHTTKSWDVLNNMANNKP